MGLGTKPAWDTRAKIGNPMKPLKISVLVVVGLAGIWMFALQPRSLHPSYVSLIGRDSAYHAKLAEECQKLQLNLKKTGLHSKELSGNDESMPRIVREISATSVVILSEDRIQGETNLLSCVIIRIGPARVGYSLVWARVEVGKETWSLTVNREGERRVLFTTNLNDAAN